MGRIIQISCVTAILTVAVTVFAEPPAATQPASEVGQWFTQLADDDPSVRDAARISLMGLSRAELEQLRQSVEQNRPLAPSQAAALHDIVIHAYLSSEPYEKNMGTGFLGVTLAAVHQPAVAAAENDNEPPPTQGIDGVMITRCVPGFCAYRYLRADDVVLGVVGQDLIATLGLNDLRDMVQATLPGDTITLQVLRQGKVMRVSFKVDALPRDVEERHVDIDEFCNPRLNKAQEYWQQKFAPLLAPAHS